METVQACDVILACTMQPTEGAAPSPPYQLFEVDADSDFECQTASLANGLYTDRRFRAALAFAKTQSDTWRRQIKANQYKLNISHLIIENINSLIFRFVCLKSTFACEISSKCNFPVREVFFRRKWPYLYFNIILKYLFVFSNVL